MTPRGVSCPTQSPQLLSTAATTPPDDAAVTDPIATANEAVKTLSGQIQSADSEAKQIVAEEQPPLLIACVSQLRLVQPARDRSADRSPKTVHELPPPVANRERQGPIVEERDPASPQ
jgi:ABC-type transporter Mla subunit MlaD